MRSKLLLIIVLTTVLFHSKAQKNQIDIDGSFHTIFSSEDLRPMWLTANQWGIYGDYGKAEAMVNIGLSYQLIQNNTFSLKAGVRGLANFDVSGSVLQEAYINGRLSIIDFSLGKEQFSPFADYDDLTTGFFLMNTNARPVPRITIGIFDYLPLGFAKDWVEIKGGISQGVLNDDRGVKSNSASDILLHEKFAYARLGNTKLKPYAGLVHSALFGGTRPNGASIPIDFWSTFFAKGSAKLGGGEETNAAGAHMGFWDFGFDWQANFGDVHFYWQKPFADASGLKLYNFYNKDYIIGTVVYPKDIDWLKGISFEVFRTDHQSGYGIPDPLYPSDYNGHSKGSIIWMEDIEGDFDGFMYEVFGETKTGWTEEEVQRYLEVELNEGHKYGGRDDYMNNGQYYNGWTYHGSDMGFPLHHTAQKFSQYAPEYLYNDHGIFVNNRVNGINVGVKGSVTKQLNYRTKLTYTNNKGAYAEEFKYRYSWERTENYYFLENKNQFYTMLELSWQTPRIKGVQVNAMLAIDFGELYHSTGASLSLQYTPNFKNRE